MSQLNNNGTTTETLQYYQYTTGDDNTYAGSSSGGSSGTKTYYFYGYPSAPTVTKISDTDNNNKYQCNLKIYTNLTVNSNNPIKIVVEGSNNDPISISTTSYRWTGKAEEGKTSFKIKASYNATYNFTFTINIPTSDTPVYDESPKFEENGNYTNFKVTCSKIYNKKGSLVRVFKAASKFTSSTSIDRKLTIESNLVNNLLHKNPGAPKGNNSIDPNKVYWQNETVPIEGLVWKNKQLTVKSSNVSYNSDRSWNGVVHEDKNGTLDLTGMPYFKNSIL